jgi:hypothetical protein
LHPDRCRIALDATFAKNYFGLADDQVSINYTSARILKRSWLAGTQYHFIIQLIKLLACAEADIATKPATVKARIKFIFIGLSLGAGSAYADVTFEDA